MSWVKLDDQFPSHPKAQAAGLQGRALYITALCWTKRHLTDGYLPKAAGKLLCAVAEVPRTTPALLVEVGLWHDEGDGWRINDFHDYNEDAQVERSRRDELSEKRREIGRLGGLRSGEVRRNKLPMSEDRSKEANDQAKTKPYTDTYRDKDDSLSKEGLWITGAEPSLSLVRDAFERSLAEERSRKNHPTTRT